MAARRATTRVSEQGPSARVAREGLGFSGRLPGFSSPVAARFEAERGRARAAHLQRSILVGLLLYNCCDFANYFLSPDTFRLGLALRLLVVTPAALGIARLAPHVAPAWREGLVTAGMILAVAVPILLFALSRGQSGTYLFFDFSLVLVFGNMTLVLRFHHAIILTLVAGAMIFTAVLLQPLLSQAAAAGLIIQTISASGIVLYSNYAAERTLRFGYLQSLRARLRSEGLEHDRDALAVLSTIDALTGLANRRMLDAALGDWLEAARGRPVAIGVMMIDVDHFKLFNDAYGHIAGDECLRRVAHAIRAALPRKDALVARYGGEEFAVVLRGIEPAGAAAIATRLCDAVRALHIPHAGRTDLLQVVSVSIGAALASHYQEDGSQPLFQQADLALYEAKHGGRNRVVSRGFSPSPQPVGVDGPAGHRQDLEPGTEAARVGKAGYARRAGLR